MSKKFLVINGPNLNALGVRETDIYGKETLDEIAKYTEKKISKMLAPSNRSVEIEWFQSNTEGDIVRKIHECPDGGISGLIINPGAYSHTSIAIYDALRMLRIPVTEVHMTNTSDRESFRSIKLTAKASKTIIEGFGKDVYHTAIYGQLHLS